MEYTSNDYLTPTEGKGREGQLVSGEVGVKQPVYWFLGGNGLGIQQGMRVYGLVCPNLSGMIWRLLTYELD